VLVNAAGIMQASHLVRTTTEQMENIIRTNLTGTILGCKAISKAMLASKSSRKEGYTASIINVSSLLGVKGGHGATVYAASKAGVLGLTRALAAEMASFTHTIRVNAIVPGYIDTQMLDGTFIAYLILSCFSLEEHAYVLPKASQPKLENTGSSTSP
jgi:NAD(P)-dependent dehydrogenase (short-subunit alcohol dehydrogenase family)